MADPRDYKVEIAGVTPAAGAGEAKAVGAKPFLSVLFACCNVYRRVYPNDERTAYVGQCPKCGKRVRFEIGEGGTSSRSFVAR